MVLTRTFYNPIYIVLLWYECKVLHSFSFERVVRAFKLISGPALSLFLLFVGIASAEPETIFPLFPKIRNLFDNSSSWETDI